MEDRIRDNIVVCYKVNNRPEVDEDLQNIHVTPNIINEVLCNSVQFTQFN